MCTRAKNVVTIYVTDDERDRLIPRGKQSELFRSHDCDYTRTTGIWQTVWLEFTPRAAYIESAKYFPDVFSHSLTIQAKLKGCGVLRATASYEGRVVGTAEAISRGGSRR